MNINLSPCPYCGKTCQMSTSFGFFKCVNLDCIKYGQNMVDDLQKYIMLSEQWADKKGSVYCKTKRGKKKRYVRR